MNDLLKQVVQPQDDSIRYIPLTRGKVAVVDAVDFEWVNQWKWHASLSIKRKLKFWTARRRTSGTDLHLLMHREILSAAKGTLVDHIDGDGLNNRRNNLRLATNQQNMFNRGMTARNTSGYKGVSWDKSSGKWLAQIRVMGRTVALGRHSDKKQAAKAYSEAAARIAGQFARTETFDSRKSG